MHVSVGADDVCDFGRGAIHEGRFFYLGALTSPLAFSTYRYAPSSPMAAPALLTLNDAHFVLQNEPAASSLFINSTRRMMVRMSPMRPLHREF